MSAATAKLDATKAYRAARALLADPDDLPQVFTLLEATGDAMMPRVLRRLRATSSGRALLAERPDIVPVLDDREALRRMPEGSLGRAYLAFVEGANISPKGIKDASIKGWDGKPSELEVEAEWLRDRLRDTHDLWHVVAGYGTDVLGEVALLAFTFAQTYNPGVAVIVSLGLYKTKHDPEARALIVDAYRRGRRAGWFVQQPWEWMLEEPLSSVRARLGLGAAPSYRPVTSAEVRSRLAA